MVAEERKGKENACVAEIHRTVDKHPLAMIVVLAGDEDRRKAMKAYQKAQVPVPVYELEVEGEDDPCLEEVDPVDNTPEFVIYRRGKQVDRLPLLGSEDAGARLLRERLMQLMREAEGEGSRPNA
ncbi:MAG: hypothetical protein ACP5UD_09940 [Conexivisphaera sp.]